MPFWLPAILFVWSTISYLTSLKSVNLWPFLCRNSACSTPAIGSTDSPLGSILRNYRTSGHLVTIPPPLGKKSRPTMDSSTELFPALCAPTTTIWGSSILLLADIILNAFYSLIIRGTRLSMPSILSPCFDCYFLGASETFYSSSMDWPSVAC